MYRLMLLTTDGYGWMYALSPSSGIGLARVRVVGETTASHVAAAQQTVEEAFRDLQAQGFPNAHSGTWGQPAGQDGVIPGMPAAWVESLTDADLTVLDLALSHYADELRSGRAFASARVRAAGARLLEDILRRRRSDVG